jgi:hypothetical protein
LASLLQPWHEQRHFLNRLYVCPGSAVFFRTKKTSEFSVFQAFVSYQYFFQRLFLFGTSFDSFALKNDHRLAGSMSVAFYGQALLVFSDSASQSVARNKY